MSATASIGEPRVLRDVLVTMRDGIQLATDIYLPAEDGPFHAILERTPYGKHLASRSELTLGRDRPMSRSEVAKAFCEAGYAVVFQDCRGRYGSQGEFTKYLSEAPDGYDTIQWIAEQEWCSGKVGTMGLSYAAHTQLAAACLAPPALAGMILDSGGFSNAYRCGIRQGGAFELKQATWAYNRAAEGRACAEDPNLRAALEAENIIDWFGRMPWSRGNSPIRWEPEYESYLLEQWQNGSFSDYWKALGIYAAGYYDQIPDIPVLLMSSWYDVYVPTTFENLAGLSKGTYRPELIMGPWTHGNRTQRAFGDVDFGPAAPFDGNIADDWLRYRIDWFDRCLKAAVPKRAPVKLFVMGGGSGQKTDSGLLDHGGHWIEVEHWPPPQVRDTVYHLHADGTLSADCDSNEGRLTYDFDPRDPVPTIGGALTSGQPVFEGGAFDQREDMRFYGCRTPGLPLSSRPDVLMFESEPLPSDVTVIGPVSVRLFVSSDAADTDFTAKLIDVHPPSADYPAGFAMNLSDGIFRCRYRNSWEEPDQIRTGEIFEIGIDLFATANLFKSGHRIRLDISSSNFPKFDVNPNTGAPEGQGRARNIARNTVHLGPGARSRLILNAV